MHICNPSLDAGGPGSQCYLGLHSESLSLKNINQAREVAQWVKHLPHRRENLYLIHIKMDVVVHVFNRSAPVVRREEAGESVEA